MQRLIDAEKLKEYKASGVSELTEWQKGWNDAIDTIMGEAPMVDAIPIEWIPCSKKLPNEDEIPYDGIEREGERCVSDRVLAINKDGFMRTGYFMNAMDAPRFGKRYEFGEHYSNDPTKWISGESCKIYNPIAWMPLPKPYVEEDGERKDAKIS